MSDAAGAEGAARRRAPKREREREVLDKAIEMFQEQGYAETSVEDVASAVGILKGSLYYYIDSKEDLLARILGDVHEGVQGIIDGVDGRTDLTAFERLRLYIREQTAFNTRRIKEITVYHREFESLTGDRLAEIKGHRHANERWLINLLKQAQAEGDIEPSLDPRLMAMCVLSPVVWMHTWYRPRGNVSASALTEFVPEFVLYGLSAAGKSAGEP